MGEIPNLRAILFAFLALFVAVAVGIPLSRARNEAVFPMLSDCQGSLAGFIECGVGVILFIAIPGAIGVFLLVFRGE